MRTKSQNRTFLKLLIALFLLSGLNSFSQTTVNTLNDLLPYLDDNNANVKLSPGTYTITASDITNGTFSPATNTINNHKSYVLFLFKGNNSTYDFTGVTINVETAVFNAIPSDAGDLFQIQITGNNNVLKNLTLEDVGSVHDYPKYGCVNVVMDGKENRIEGFHMTTRGSFPYGYGDCFGKGGTYTIKHYKHSAFLIRGLRNHALNDTIKHYSYGHCMFMQAASYPTIEGCHLTGEMRSTDEMLAEEGTGSAADLIDFYTVWGYRLPPGFMKSTGEAGIRAYNAGNTVIDGVEYERGTDNPTILDCYVKNLRVGVTLTHAKGKKYVKGVTAIGTERGFAIGTGDIIDCYSDVQYGPALGVDYETDKNCNAEITILPYEGETYNGDKYCAYITGSGHNITLRSQIPNPDQELKIEFGGDRRLISGLGETTNYTASNITLNNYTNYPVVLNDKTNDNTGVSGGMVTDFGTNNNIVHTSVSTGKYEAEDYTTASGVAKETSTDEGGGANVTAIEPGDWMEYEIDVPFDGTYSLDFRVASDSEGGDFTVSIEAETLANVSFTATGGNQTWQTIGSESPLSLNKGLQKIRITANNAGWNLNWLELTLECIKNEIKAKGKILNPLGESIGTIDSAEITVFPGTTLLLEPEPSVGGTWDWLGVGGFSSATRIVEINDIQKSNAGDYLVSFMNDCGQGSTKTFNIMVEDTFVFEAEAFSKMEGAEIQNSESASEGKIVNSINNGNWIEYELDVPVSATFLIDYRTLCSSNVGSFTVSVDSIKFDEISYTSNDETAAWTTLSSDSLIYLTEGKHLLRLDFTSNNWSIDWIRLSGEDLVSPCALPVILDGFTIENSTFGWTSGVIDISCASSINVYADIAGAGDLNASNNLEVYYKLDGGEAVEFYKNTGAISDSTLIARALLGNTIELLIKADSEQTAGSQYKIENIHVVETTDPFAKIEAEDYEKMQGVNNSGSRLGNIQPGEWSMYSGLDLTGVSSIEAKVGTVYHDAYIEVRVGAVDGLLIGTISVPNTGNYNTYHSATGTIQTITGIYDVYLVYQTNGSPNVCNIDWFQFSGGGTNETPDSSGKIEAEEYKEMSGIDTETTKDEGGGLNVGWINNDDWLMFANIDLSGVKSINTRLATDKNPSTIEIRIDSATGNLIGTVNVSNTGGFQIWETVNTTLTAIDGTHDVFLVFKGETGYLCNINWIQFVGTPTAITPGFAENEILIYPNPVKDKLIIKGALNLQYEIYNNMGSLVDSNSIENDRQSIDMNRLISGMYFIRIVNGNAVLNSFKVVKQ